MPGCVSEALSHFKPIWSGKPKDQPYAHVVPSYGANVQYAPDDNTSRPATKEEEIFVQQVVETFLYYGRAVDGTMLTALSAVAFEQASPTENTIRKTQTFMDYAATHPDTVLTCRWYDPSST